MNNEEVLTSLLEELYRIGNEVYGETDIIYNNKCIEIVMAHKLGLTINKGTQGFDAFEKDGSPVELKCAIQKNNGTHGAWQFHWLSKNKLAKYRDTSFVYLILREGVSIIYAYKLKMSEIYKDLEKKAREKGIFLQERDDFHDAHYSISTIKKIKELGGIRVA
jgi:hypothetical protein